MSVRDASASADGMGKADSASTNILDAPAADSGTLRDSPSGLDQVKGRDVLGANPDMDAGGGCHVDIAAIAPASLSGLTAGPTSSLRVQGSIVWGGDATFSPAWNWSVTRSDGQVLIPQSVGLDASLVQFPISIAARYDITVSIGDGCTGTARALAQDAQSDYRVYHLLVLPPDMATSTAVPSEFDVKVSAHSPAIGKDVDFAAGTAVTIDPSTSPGSALALAVPSLIQIQSSGSMWITSGRSTQRGPLHAVLDALLDYRVLVVPDPPSDGETLLPPFLLDSTASNGATVDSSFIANHANPLPLPQGIGMVGKLALPNGPAAGATISLHSYRSTNVVSPTDVLFSTVGTADAQGAYSLRVNPDGVFSLVATPPADSPWPIATIDQAINLVDPSVKMPEVDFQWLDLPTTNLDLAVTWSVAALPSDPIIVHLESTTGALPNVGTLTVGTIASSTNGNAWTASASGLVRRDGQTDSSGNVHFGKLPKAPYRVTLVPPASLSGGALTTLSLDLSAVGSDVQATLPIAPKVAVIGRLLDALDDQTTDSAGATIQATDLGHDLISPVVTATVTQDGTYLLVLDPDRTYQLVAYPATGRGLPSYVPLYGFSTGNANMQLDDQRIPKGVLVSGQVTFAGAAVPGAIVQAFCIGLPPDCVDRNNLSAGSPPAYASAISNDNGAYAIYLPDPAVPQ